MNSSDLLTINCMRVLSMEAIQKANSGHPGITMGAAPMAYELWAHHMKHNPINPEWVNRDRFVLSAGHGSMLEYSLLHLFGYGITVDDIKESTEKWRTAWRYENGRRKGRQQSEARQAAYSSPRS